MSPIGAGAAPAHTAAASSAEAQAEAAGRGPLRLGALADIVGYHVAQAAVYTTATFERHVGQPLNLRKVEYSLLLLLQANPPQTPKRLGQALALSAPNLTLLLDRLAQRGLIRRERSTTDRRSHHIVLTEAGAALTARGIAAVDAMEADTAEGRLSCAERLMLIELLRKLAGR